MRYDHIREIDAYHKLKLSVKELAEYQARPCVEIDRNDKHFFILSSEQFYARTDVDTEGRHPGRRYKIREVYLNKHEYSNSLFD